VTRIFRHDPMSFDSLPVSLKALAGASIVIYAAQVLGNFFPSLDYRLIDHFGLVPGLVLQWPAPEFWRVATYLFLHGNIWHLVFNLFALWMFGMPVVAQWGDREFVKFFFLCGIGAAAMQLALSHGSMIPTIGFSGSVYGMLVAFALLYPDAVVYVYFLIPMKAAHMAILFGLIEFFAGAAGATPGVARFAHLGGMITGYFYIRWWWVWKLHLKSMFKGALERDVETVPVRPAPVARRSSREKGDARVGVAGDMTEVDRILDKILVSGLDSLTDDERGVMRRYSERNKPS
jgi:membrane associated rhomboid family serine protease